MSDRLKKLKKLGIAVSYIALLSATNSFAASSELSRAQEEQFDIFDVESEQLDEIDSPANSGDDIPMPSFSEFEDDNEIVDDLFVDSVNESGDIDVPKESRKKSRRSKDASDAGKELAKEKDEAPKEQEKKQASGKSDKEIMLDDEDYVFNTDESDSLEIQEEEEFKKLLLESVGTEDNMEVPAIDGLAVEEDNNAVDDLFSEVPSIEDSNEMGMEAPSALDSLEDEMESFMMGDESPSIEMNDPAQATSPAMVDTSPTQTDKKHSGSDPEYKNLRTHLDNFLLSFAGEDTLSESKTSEIPNIEAISGENDSNTNEEDLSVDDITAFDPEQMFENDNEMNIDENMGMTETGMNEGFDENIPSIDDITNEDTATNIDDNMENIDDIDVEVAIDNNEIENTDNNEISDVDQPDNFDDLFSDNEIDIEQAKEDEAQKIAEAKRAEEERLQKERDEQERKEKHAKIVGSCNNLPEKISACESFECEMPDPTGGSETVKISINPDNELCNYKTTMQNKPSFVCGLNDSETSMLSSITDDYFESVGGNKFDVQSEFPDQCMSTKVAMDKKNQEKQANQQKQAKAYRALLAGQTSAAVVLYNQVLDLDKENMDALFGLATAYHKNFQYEQARSTYAKILRIEPGNKEVLNNFLVLVAEESPESALLELQKLERINSNFSPIPAQIAMIYLKLGQPETAERYLRRAVILSPDNITYKYNLAITSDKLNKHYQAINLYKQVLEAAKKGAIIPGSISSISSRMDYLEGKISSMN